MYGLREGIPVLESGEDVNGPHAGIGARERYKRPFDLTVVALALGAFLPLWVALWIVISLAIRLESGGPVLYRQTRLGRGGAGFQLLKFRTMMPDAEAETGPVLAAVGDQRVTGVGVVLRRFHLDELPQVVNILRGEMSLVGPRPERPELAARYGQTIPDFTKRLWVRPGLAGLAQAVGPYHLPPRRKLHYDLAYIQAMNPWLDLGLCLSCLWRALREPGL